jgi:cyclophilin family peptidyl-prolyl cis-trans isomerase
LKNEDPNTTDPSQSAPKPNSTPRRVRALVAIALPVAAALVIVFFWWPRANKPGSPDLPASKASPSSQAASPTQGSPDSHGLPEGHPAAEGSGSLLQQMGQDQPPDTADLSGPVATAQQLEAQYATIAENEDQINKLRNQAASAAKTKNSEEVKRNLERGKPLVSLLNTRLAAFEKDLAAARRARPNDPVGQWLTGELLILVGGEPEDILPYLNRAVSANFERPHLFASLAAVEFDLNHFQAAYIAAAKAVARDPHGQAALEIYARAGFAVEKFVEVLQKIDFAFPGDTPAWARAIRRNATQLQKSWIRETAQRRQDQRQGDLPLVKLVVEHRKFAGAADGGQAGSVQAGTIRAGTIQAGTVQAAGRGDVEIELFEDQAPATVSNFIHLVESGFYNGTSFYWAEAGHMVVGGDPNTKNADPADDGLGGPGYVIPDEFNLPSARGHFRGTLSTVQNAPGRAGSQFFITLVAAPEFDGYSTAFGRVIRGQEVLDQVTEGRTNREVGQFGKIIPGDLIVRAEVVRKRPHPYVVTQLSPKRP